MMVILADPAPTDAVDLLEIITAECPLTGTGSPDDVLVSISFFRVMHEGFGIPYDVMEIYAYDRIDPDAAIEVSWPTKYLSVYWNNDGDVVVPSVTTEEVNDQRATVEAYSLSVVPLEFPYVFSFWSRPLDHYTRLEEPPDLSLELRSQNCLPGPVCAVRLFDDQQFRDQYYPKASFPFEAVQMTASPESGSAILPWTVAYLTNEPLLLSR